jgi:hypothetical protein
MLPCREKRGLIYVSGGPPCHAGASAAPSPGSGEVRQGRAGPRERRCGPRHKLRLWRLVPTRRYRRGVDRGIGIIPAQKRRHFTLGQCASGSLSLDGRAGLYPPPGTSRAPSLHGPGLWGHENHVAFPVTATTDFLAPDILNRCGLAVPAVHARPKGPG